MSGQHDPQREQVVEAQLVGDSGWPQPRQTRTLPRRQAVSMGFTGTERWMMILAGVGCLSLFGVARLLTPSESGMGTHRSLGLPPCGALVMWGKPCPSCGMTTSWAWFTRGQFGRAWHANPGGFVLALFVIKMSVWLGVSGGLNRWWPATCQPWYILTIAAAVLAVTLVQWLFRLF